MSQQNALVRLKQLNKKRGNVIKRYTIFGMTFNVDDGWTVIPSEYAEMLEEKTIDPQDFESSAVFDVCYSREDAEAIERKDRKLAMITKRQRNYRGPRKAKIAKRGLLVPEKKKSREMETISATHVGNLTDDVLEDEDLDGVEQDELTNGIEDFSSNANDVNNHFLDPTIDPDDGELVDDNEFADPVVKRPRVPSRKPATKAGKKPAKKAVVKAAGKKAKKGDK